MHVGCEEVLLEFLYIIDLGYGDDGKFAQVRVDEDRLGVGIADDAYAGIALELGESRFELSAEI
jgi:hypothetical protein